MKVKDLIGVLKELDPELPLLFDTGDWCEYGGIKEIIPATVTNTIQANLLLPPSWLKEGSKYYHVNLVDIRSLK